MSTAHAPTIACFQNRSPDPTRPGLKEATMSTPKAATRSDKVAQHLIDADKNVIHRMNNQTTGPVAKSTANAQGRKGNGATPPDPPTDDHHELEKAMDEMTDPDIVELALSPPSSV